MYEGKKRFICSNDLLKYISVYISHTSHVQSLLVKDFRAGHKTISILYINNYCTTLLSSNSLWNVHRNTAKTEQKIPRIRYCTQCFVCLVSCFSAAVELSVYFLPVIWSDLRKTHGHGLSIIAISKSLQERHGLHISLMKCFQQELVVQNFSVIWQTCTFPHEFQRVNKPTKTLIYVF